MTHILHKLTQFPYTFVLMNWAALAGLYHFVRGHEGYWNAPQARRLSGTQLT